MNQICTLLRRLHMGLVIKTFMLFLMTSEGALVSQPSSLANKYLIACDGDHISLNCSHGNTRSGSTRWIIGPPIDCLTTINHNPSINDRSPQPCGPFTLHALTEAVPGVAQLNSTAMATALPLMSGSVVDCRGGNVFASSSVGNLTLCIAGPIRNLRCIHAPNGLNSTWDHAVVAGKCSGSPMNYTVTITQESNDSIVHQFEVNNNRIKILNALEPSQNYSLSVTSNIRGEFCANEASVQCETGSDLLPETTTTTEVSQSSSKFNTNGGISSTISENSLLIGFMIISVICIIVTHALQ